MTVFAQLPANTQLDRLDALAQRAAQHYGFATTPARISYTNNAVYRIDSAGAVVVLRVHRPDLKRREWIQAELDWLTSLGSVDGLRVPVPAGALYTGTLEGHPRPVYCTLFHWQHGDAIPAQTETTAYAVGQFAARLHTASAALLTDAPRPIMRPRLDWDGLFGDNAPYRPAQDGESLFTDAQRALMHAAAQRIRQTMDALGDTPQTFGMIHADLITKNMLWDHTRAAAPLIVLDFDDCAYGYYLYDLAPLLLYQREAPNAATVRQALWAGYTDIRPQPQAHQAHLDAFIAARHIASIRWIAGNAHNPAIRDRATDIIRERVALLHTFLDHGSL